MWIASALAPNGLASGTTITATYGSSIGYPTIGGLSLNGIDPGNPIDGTPLGPTEVSTTGWSTGNYAISAGSAIVAVNYSGGVVTGNTPTSPSVESQEQITAADQAHVIEYRLATSAGSYPVAGAWNATSPNTTIAVAFNAASSGARRVGTASQVDASGGNGNTTVTIPAGATGCIAFWEHWNGDSTEEFRGLDLGSNNKFTVLTQRPDGFPTSGTTGVGIA